MTQPAKAQEPSMEEILASIRRIIADEEATKPQTRAAPEPTPGRASVESAPLGRSEPAAPRAAAEPVEPDANETTPTASAVQESSDIDAHANDDFEDAPATAEHAPRPAGGHLRTIEAVEPLLSAEATAAVN